MKRLLLGLVVASTLAFGFQPMTQQAEAKSLGAIVNSALNAVGGRSYSGYGYPYYGGYGGYSGYGGYGGYGSYYGGYPYNYNVNYSPYVNPYYGGNPYYGYSNPYNVNTGSTWMNLLQYLL
jgi:hypothetical protein